MEPQSSSCDQKLTVAEAARYFNRSQWTIRRWCHDGTLLAFNCKVIRERPGCWLIVVPSN